MECRCFLFENFKQVYSVLGLILLFDFVFKIFYAERFSKVLIRILCDLRWKSAKLKYSRFCSKNVVDGKFLLTCGPLIDEVDGHKKEKLNSSIGSEKVMNTDSDEECFSDEDDDDGEFDVLTLRKLLMIERCKVNAALAELVRERAAYSSAADEAMAMILRLQREKSLIEMESSQFRRLAEEKQIHDQEVIRSLQWMVWDHESKRRLLEDQLRLRRSKMKKDESEEFEEDESCFSGNILDALENVLYSSRDANNLLLE